MCNILKETNDIYHKSLNSTDSCSEGTLNPNQLKLKDSENHKNCMKDIMIIGKAKYLFTNPKSSKELKHNKSSFVECNKVLPSKIFHIEHVCKIDKLLNRKVFFCSL